MPAYIIASIEVTDPGSYEAYKAQAAAAIEQYGGSYVVRGGLMDTLEGETESRRVVIVQFDSMEAARRFSAEYRKARATRADAAQAQFILVEGVPG